MANTDLRFYLTLLYLWGCFLAIVIVFLTCIELSSSTIYEQYAGETTLIPKWVYIFMLSMFYLSGIVYGTLKWYFTIDDSSPHIMDTEDYNIDWNVLSFFATTFIIFVFVAADDMRGIFIFAMTFTMAVFCSVLLILFSVIKKKI